MLDGYKVCARCKVNLSIEHFDKNKSKAFGLNSSCKPCVKKYYEDRYQKENGKARNKKIVITDDGRKKICFQCRSNLDVACFKVNKGNVKGLDQTCIPCKKLNKEEAVKKITKNNNKKLCTGCNIELSISNFSSSNKSTDGFQYQCNSCHDAYRFENKDIINFKKRVRNKEFRKNNRNKMSLANKKYRSTQLYQDRQKIARKKKQKNPVWKLRKNLSSAILYALKSNNSSKCKKSCLPYLNYTIVKLKTYLESKFENWMSWDNHGNYNLSTWNDNDSSTWTWHIDHIIPHSKFKYTSMEDEAFKQCWSLSNLRPLSAKQNIIDGNRR